MSLYRVEFEGGVRHVEAGSFANAVIVWRSWIIGEFGPDSGWDQNSDPDSVTRIDEESVLTFEPRP